MSIDNTTEVDDLTRLSQDIDAEGLPLSYIQSISQPKWPAQWRCWSSWAFLSALAKPYGDKGFLELRGLRGANGKHGTARLFIPLSGINTYPEARVVCLNNTWRWISNHDRQKYDLYCGVLPREEQGGKKEFVKRAGMVWLDVDFKNGRDKAFEVVRSWNPDMAVLSGRGIHCYHLLDEVIDISDKEVRSNFETHLSRINHEFGCDPVQNVDRILRIPGTHNWKDKDDPLRVLLARLPKGIR